MGYNKEIGRLPQAIPQNISVIMDVFISCKCIKISKQINCKSVEVIDTRLIKHDTSKHLKCCILYYLYHDFAGF